MEAPSDIQKRYTDLRRAIDKHSTLYHSHVRPEISDAEYDDLRAQAVALEQRYPKLATDGGVMAQVGAKPLKRFTQAKHVYPTLTLKNAFSAEQIEKFVQDLAHRLTTIGQTYTADSLVMTSEPKLDGVNLGVAYRHGKLFSAVTRGDGVVGEVVTHNALTIANLPADVAEFAPHERIEVRGEAIIEQGDFIKLNDQLSEAGKSFATARNLVAGSIRQLDAAVTAQRADQVFCLSIDGAREVF